MRKFAIALALVLTVAVGALFGRPGAQGQSETGILGQVISQALSTPNSTVTIGAVDGALSSDATIRDISIADPSGIWLRVDKVRLIWRRTALLQRRLEVEKLEIGKLEILRPADPGPPGPASKPEGTPQPLLPELPLKVDIQKFSLGELVLGEKVLGAAATIGAEGNAKLGPPSEGLNLVFNATRKDRPGRFETRLSLVPATETLDIKLNFEEPEGGLVARVASLPGLPPVTLKLEGAGRLDAFNANLNFVAGPSIGAVGKALLARQGAGRRLGLDMEARIEGLLPPAVAPIFGGATQLGGGVFFADTGALDLQDISVLSKLARLDVSGKIDAAKVADLTIKARALPTEGGVTRAGDIRIGSLVFDGTVKGPVATPWVDAKFNLGDAELPAGKVKFAQVTAAVAPTGVDGAMKVAVEADANGLAATDPAINRALGERARFTLDATVDKAGLADIAALKINGQAVDATFAGKAGAKVLDGVLNLSAPDLSRFAGLSGLALKGALNGTIGVKGAPDAGRIEASPDLKATKFATGIAALDGALGGVVGINGAVRMLPGGGYGFGDLKLAGQHLRLRLDGEAGASQAAIDIAGEASDLKKVDARLTGKATLAGRVTGTAQKPDATMRIELAQASAMERAIPRLTLDIAGTDLIASPNATVKLDGSIGGKPAKGGLALARQGQDGWKIDGLDVAIGSVAIKGAVALAGKAANGTIEVAATDLNDISPLLLTQLSGNLDAKIVLKSEGGKQSAAITGRGNRMRFGEASIDRLVADLRALDLYNRPGLAGTLTVDRAEVGKETISRIRLDARPPEAGGDISLVATARGFDISGTGKLEQGARSRLNLSRFEARKGGKRIALAAPGAIEFGEGRVALSRLVIAVDGGRIDLDGQVSPVLNLVANARNVPLAALEIVSPGLGLSGTLSAEAKVSGTPASPNGNWRATVAGLSLPQTRAQGIPPLQIAANGALAGGRTSLESTINAGKIGTFRTSGSAPIDGKGALDLRVAGKADIGFLNSKLAATGQRVGGAANVDVAIAGPTASPQISGGATLAGVSFSDAEQGFSLTNMSGHIAATGKTVTLQNITGQTRNGGRLVVGGEVSLNSDAGFPGRITLRANEAELVSSSLATAVANVALDISGPLARRPTIGGTVNFTRLDVTVPERLPGGARPLDHVKHLNAPAYVKARLAAKKKAQGKRRNAPAFDAALNITLSAPNRVFVRGRGLDAEMAGDMKLTGTLAKPTPIGGFQMRKGKLVVAGKRLDFTRGKLVFSGTTTPELDFLAQSKAGEVTVQIGVSGAANAPKFAFTSDPDLPQEEVFSRLLFNKGSGNLGPAQALQIALVAAQFAGEGGDDAFEKMRKQLGVNSLDVNMGADGKVGVGASRAINDRISVGVRAGAKPNDTAVSADVDVTRNIRVQGEVTAGGNTSVGIGFEKEY